LVIHTFLLGDPVTFSNHKSNNFLFHLSFI